MRYSDQLQLIASIPAEETSQVRTRAKRKAESEDDDDEGGVPLTPTKVLKSASVLNAEVHSPRSQTSRRRTAKRFALKEEVDDLREEAQREANFAEQTVSATSISA